MKHQGLKTVGRERFQPDPQGEKTYLKMFRELETSFPSDECFLDGKKSKKSRPPLAGQQNLRFVHRIGPMEKKKV